jgi:dGTPase
LRSGLITEQQLKEVSLFFRHFTLAWQEYPRISGRRLIHETVRRMINTLVADLTRQSEINIAVAQPTDLSAVRSAPYLIGFSEEIRREQQELKQFLRENLYRHYKVVRMSAKAHHTVERLFEAFKSDVRLMPPVYQQKYDQDKYQAIADYIAGMTDRYAIREYRRLFGIEET